MIRIKHFQFIILLIFSGISTSYSHATEVDAIAQLESIIVKHKGEVIYVDFWASWCIPCRKSFPWMNDINKQYAEKGFRVISINLDAEKHLADKFLLETPADFAVIFDAKGLTAKKFKLKGMPSSFLINKEGKIIITHSGFFSDKKPLYQKEIESLLAE